jgi:hypothetical protein
MKGNYVWLKILEEAQIDPFLWEKVSPQIQKKAFHNLNLQPKNFIPIYSEKERKRKLGFRDNIWPFRNGIGRCVLIDGDLSLKNNYSNPSNADLYSIENYNAVSVSLNNSNTEREFLHLAYNSGVFNQLLGSKKLSLGTSGKLYVNAIANYFKPIELQTVQFELDWSLETKDTIALFEAKLPTTNKSNTNKTSEFIIFQAFYPILYASQIKHSKKIRFFFVDIIRSTSKVDFHFMEIDFKNPMDLQSYNNIPKYSTTIRMKINK